jgi:preprotein translocase subunit SecE
MLTCRLHKKENIKRQKIVILPVVAVVAFLLRLLENMKMRKVVVPKRQDLTEN